MNKFMSFLLSAALIVGAVPTFAAEVELPVRPVVDGSYVVSAEKYNAYETDHFQLLWGDSDKASKVTDEFLKGSGKILEDCWEIFIDEMGMTPPNVSIYGNSDKAYKVNVVIMGTGIDGYLSGWAYGGVDSEGYPYLMCDPDAMTPYPESWVIPHEFGHVTHFGQNKNAWSENTYLSPWYEAIGNWFREQYLNDTTRYTAGLDNRTDLSAVYLRAANLMPCNGRAYYEAWPILQYLTDNPDELPGYGEKFVSSMLNYRSESDTLYDVMEKLNPSVSYEDTMGYFASRMATMDFKENRENYRKKMAAMLADGRLYWQQLYTVPAFGGEEGLYYVSGVRAPQASGYNIIPLKGEGEISVALSPLTKAEGAAWRARLAVKHADGSVEYSKLFAAGEVGKVSALSSDEVFLSVAATPALNTVVKCGIGNWENKYSEANIPFESKTQYPYSFKLENAALVERPQFQGGHSHPNGGGFVANTATVASTAYVGKNAAVLNYATVSDNAVITGNAIVGGWAKVSGNAFIGGEAIVNEGARISGNARVLESALVGGEYTVTDNAVIKGQALCLGRGTAKGTAMAYGDFFEDMGNTITSGAFAGYESVAASDYGHFADKYSFKDSDGSFYRQSDGLLYKYDFNDFRDRTAYSDMAPVNGAVANGSLRLKKGQYAIASSYMLSADTTLEIDAQGEGALFYISGDEGYISISVKEGDTVLNVNGTVGTVPKDEGIIRLTLSDGAVTLRRGGRGVTLLTEAEPKDFTGKECYVGKQGDEYFEGSVGHLYVSLADDDTMLKIKDKKIIVNTEDFEQARLVIAQYDGESLKSVRIYDVMSDGGNAEFDLPKGESKIMLLDSMDDLKPLCQAIVGENIEIWYSDDQKSNYSASIAYHRFESVTGKWTAEMDVEIQNKGDNAIMLGSGNLNYSTSAAILLFNGDNFQTRSGNGSGGYAEAAQNLCPAEVGKKYHIIFSGDVASNTYTVEIKCDGQTYTSKTLAARTNASRIDTVALISNGKRTAVSGDTYSDYNFVCKGFMLL